MRKALTTAQWMIFLSLSGVPLSASAQCLIRGTVQDDAGKGVPFANVLLLKVSDSTLVRGAVTGETGTFQISEAKAGQYLLTASSVAYGKTFSQPFTVSPNQQALVAPLLVLKSASNELAAVEVVAQKPLFEQQLDRMVVNVQSSITLAGATALDVLERSPGITVNRPDNALSLNGKSGVLVMLNGKVSRLPQEALLQLLAGMPASTIEKIELIPTPPAGYDAEGDAGIIHIVQRKNTAYGTNGSVDLSAGYGLHEKLGSSLLLNHRQRKLNLFGDYAFQYDHHWLQFDLYRQVDGPEKYLRSESRGRANRYRRIHTGRIGFDYTLNPNTQVSGLVAGLDNFLRSYHDRQALTVDNGKPVSFFDLQWDEFDRWQHAMGNLNVRHTFAKKHTLSVDADFLWYRNQSPNAYRNQHQWFTGEPPGEGQRTEEHMTVHKNTPIRSWVYKADYTLAFGPGSSLELGAKSTLFGLKNTVLVHRSQAGAWQYDPGYSLAFRLSDNIHAAYLNMSHTLGGQVKLQAGLRYEYTHTHIQTFDHQELVRRRYGNLFPSVFLSRPLSKSSSLQFAYSRRIVRPPYNILAPFVFFADPSIFTTGNPKLKPTFSNALQGTLLLKEKYIIQVKYSRDKDAMNRFAIRVDANQNTMTAYPDNIRLLQTLSVALGFPLSITPWWQTQWNLLGIGDQATAEQDGTPLQVKNYHASLNTSSTFRLPGDCTGELTAFYQTPALFGLYQMKARGSVNVGLQKKLTANKGSLKLSVTDLFWTNRTRIINDLPALRLVAGWSAFGEPRVVRFSYSRSFGNQSVKAATKRATGSEEERGRVN